MRRSEVLYNRIDDCYWVIVKEEKAMKWDWFVHTGPYTEVAVARQVSDGLNLLFEKETQ